MWRARWRPAWLDGVRDGLFGVVAYVLSFCVRDGSLRRDSRVHGLVRDIRFDAFSSASPLDVVTGNHCR